MRDITWVERTMHYSGGLCQHSGRILPGCARCVAACPSGALSSDRGGIRLDSDACIDCGDCVSVCPSGALSRKRSEIEAVHREILRREGTVIVFVDAALNDEALSALKRVSKIPGCSPPILLENPGFLSETEFALAVQASGRAVIVPALDDTSSRRAFVRAAERLAEITALLFTRPLVHVPKTIETLETIVREAVSVERRRFPAVGSPFSEPEKRELLGTLIEGWLRGIPDRDGAPPVIHADSFAKITCDRERCISCGACANHCKVGALRLSSDGERLLHHPFPCVNCGVCVQVCPEGALDAHPGLILGEDFLKVREIARFHPVRCESCGRPFTTAKKSRRVLDSLNAALGNDPIREKLLRFCPECRAVQAFTTFGNWTREKR